MISSQSEKGGGGGMGGAFCPHDIHCGRPQLIGKKTFTAYPIYIIFLCVHVCVANCEHSYKSLPFQPLEIGEQSCEWHDRDISISGGGIE